VRLGGRHNMPPPRDLDFWPFDLEVGVGVACDLGYPCAKFRLPRPFGFRVRADVRDIRRTTDADHRLMPPLRGGGIIMLIVSDYVPPAGWTYIISVMIYLPPTKEEVYVFARVHLSVCLWARLRKKACMDLDNVLRRTGFTPDFLILAGYLKKLWTDFSSIGSVNFSG